MSRFNEDFERLAEEVYRGDCAAAARVLDDMRREGTKAGAIMRASRKARPIGYVVDKVDPNPMPMPFDGVLPPASIGRVGLRKVGSRKSA